MEEPLTIPFRRKSPLHQNQPPHLHQYSHLLALEKRQIQALCAIIQPWGRVGAVAPHLRTEDAGSRGQGEKDLT